MTVIGVLQAAPYFPDRADALLNMVISPHHLSAQMVQGRTHRMTEMIARLAPGATVPQARAEVAAVYARMQRDHQDAYDPGSHYRVAVIPFKEVLGERARLTLWLLMAAAAFVLIISAANVANLTLMRGVQREHELVVPGRPGCRRGPAEAIAAGRKSRADTRGGAASACSSRSEASGCSPRSPSGTPRAPAKSASTAWCWVLRLALAVALALLLSFTGVAAQGRRLRLLDCRRDAPDQRQPEEAATAAGTGRRHRSRVSVVLLAGAGIAHPYDDPAFQREHGSPDRAGAHDGGTAHRSGDGDPRGRRRRQAALPADAA